MGRILSSKILWLLVGGLVVLVVGWRQGWFKAILPEEVVNEIGIKVRQGKQSFLGGGEVGFDYPEDVAGKENLAKLKQGCPFKDCIPAIDKPKFESREEADEWLSDEDIVLGLDYKGEHRAYPQKILNWHEIVNDEVAGEPIAVTFCPLCGSALGFERKIEGPVSAEASTGEQTLEFGVSGKVHNSCLVMYDRESESLWEQITGEALVGERFGQKLKQIPIQVMTWGEWKREHVATKVLSRNTGYKRDYDTHPYGTYEQDTAVYFPVEVGVESEVHPKTVVYGVVVGDKAKAYTLKAVRRETMDDSVLSDTVGGQRIRISYNQGEIFIEDFKTKGEIIATRMFWFAWKAFYSKTELYE